MSFLLLLQFAFASCATPLKLYYKFDNEFKPVGSGSLIGQRSHILTAAHLISKTRAKEGCDLKAQIAEIEKLGAIFLSPKIVCKNPDTNNQFVDGAILIPISSIRAEILDLNIPPAKITKDQDCLDDAYLYASKSGLKNNLIQHLSNRTLRRGDSGSVIVNKTNNEAIAVFYGHGNTVIHGEGYPTSYFFPLDGKEGLVSIVRVMPGQVTVKRLIPPGCKAYEN